MDQLADYGVDEGEELCASAWLELQRRAAILQEAYPFRPSASRLERVGNSPGYWIYVMLVLLTLSSQFRQTKIRGVERKEIAKLFECITALALERYLGGRSVMTGHPRVDPVPKRFGGLLTYLSEQLGESVRSTAPLNPDTKDCRADVVVWRAFRDRRGGQVVVMAQCATGQNWKEKLTELNIDLWKRYIEFVVPPLRAFAIPFVEPDAALWLEYGTLGGVALDRLRISGLIAERPLPAPLRTAVRTWSQRKLARVPYDA